MILSDTSEARVRGYLYVLERSLHASLRAAVVADAVREVESHIRDRVAESQPLPDERAALDPLLRALGGQRFVQQHQVEGTLPADQPRQQPGRTEVRHQPDPAEHLDETR